MKKAGRPRLKEAKVERVTIRLTKQERNKLKKIAKANGKDESEFVREVLEKEYLSK